MLVIKVVNFQKIVKVVLILVLSMINLSAGEVFCRESSCVKILTGSSVGAGRRENDVYEGRPINQMLLFLTLTAINQKGDGRSQ